VNFPHLELLSGLDIGFFRIPKIGKEQPTRVDPPGPASWVCDWCHPMGPCGLKDLVLGFILCCCCLEILNKFIFELNEDQWDRGTCA
jgi:hypothetical protein